MTTEREGATLPTTAPGNGLVNGHPAGTDGSEAPSEPVKSAPPPPEGAPTPDDGAVVAVKDANPRTAFSELPLFAYGLIMADPPWDFRTYSQEGQKKGPASHYDVMSVDEIKALPVGHLAAPDCLLWLWATHPMLPQQIDVVAAWGFRFVTSGVWVKRTKNGFLNFGTGYRLRCASEPFLIATNGNPQTANNVRTVIEGQIREHSRKPEEAFAAAEALVPNVRRLELFSRESRPGWDTWGNEAGKFDAQQAEHTFENAGDVAARVVANAARGGADV